MRISKVVRRAAVLCVAAEAVTMVCLTPAWAGTPATKTVFAAGYETTAYTPVTSASAQITLPAIKCPAKENASIDPLVTVAGPEKTVNAGIRLECVDGVAAYQAHFYINGSNILPSLPVKTGDEIKEYASQTTAGSSVSLTDVRTGRTVSRTGTGAADDYAAIVTDAVTVPPDPIPNFGHVTFTNVQVDGANLGSAKLEEEQMYSGTSNPPPANSQLMVSTSPISTGTSFTCTFVRAS
jgi:hypothetical protein